jgi:hypothetical protein
MRPRLAGDGDPKELHMNLARWVLLATLMTGSPPAREADMWRKDGVLIPDRPNMKSERGFGAQLFLTASEQFFDDWEKPQTPHLPLLTDAERNVPFFTVIMFVNPQLDGGGKAHVTCDITVRKPDGSIYGRELNVSGWEGPYSTPANHLQLTTGGMGIRIEPHDPPGTYVVEVIVRDNHRKVALPLKTTFTVSE